MSSCRVAATMAMLRACGLRRAMMDGVLGVAAPVAGTGSAGAASISAQLQRQFLCTFAAAMSAFTLPCLYTLGSLSVSRHRPAE